MQNRSEYTVHVHRDGVLHSFGPNADIPDWAAALVNNPYVNGDVPDPRAELEKRTADATEPPADNAAEATSEEPVSGRPPEAGPGASRAVWEEYAIACGITVDPNWKREDIIAACAAAGV